MGFLWSQLRQAVPLIYHGDSYIWSVTWVTLRLALVSTVAATVIGLPFALMLGLGRFRGRRVLQALANASMALPSVVVGVFVLILLLPGGVLGSLQIRVHAAAASTSRRRCWRCRSSSRSCRPRSKGSHRPAATGTGVKKPIVTSPFTTARTAVGAPR